MEKVRLNINLDTDLRKVEEHGMQAGQALHGKLWDCRKLKKKREIRRINILKGGN